MLHSVRKIKLVQLYKALGTTHSMCYVIYCCYYNAMPMLPPFLHCLSLLPIPIPQKTYTHGDTGVALCIPGLNPFSLISLKRRLYFLPMYRYMPTYVGMFVYAYQTLY